MKRTRNSQSGVALVITLILLSVITFMAVTFLVVSRHEGAQVDVISQQSNAKLAADSAAQQAMAQIIAQMQAYTNGLNGGLLVSTNFQSSFFATGGSGYGAITNVNYTYQNGTLINNTGDLEQMLNNLLILPRPPVFVYTNKNTPPDFRYWLDLNRNGIYDTNGPVVEVDGNGNPVVNTYIGDPEWVGILNHPDQRHSSSNFFVARYAFIALPIGNSLDINYIHNQSKLLGPWSDGFLRNQGVGSWEINLAAFLHELNPNWDNNAPPYSHSPYNYNTATGAFAQSSSGSSFDDADAILQYRYANSYANLRSFSKLYQNSPLANVSFTSDFIDGYAHGPLMTGYQMTIDPDGGTLTKFPWCGDFSTNRYFDTQDLFNLVPYYQNNSAYASTSFSNHLYSLGRDYNFPTRGSITNSINRYTFYRMLSQMSFESASEPAQYPYMASANTNYSSVYGNTPRMNLNYVNVGGLSATNFVPWGAAQFFTNAADRMLRAYFPNPIGVTNGKLAYLSLNYIPIYPTNYYTPAVHRILQLAANIYDSINTNRIYDSLTTNGPPYFPSVFKPYFASQVTGNSTNIWITGYVEVTTNVGQYGIDYTFPKDLRRGADLAKFLSLNATPPNPPAFINIYGIPYVIGAKAGFPSFNKFSSTPMVEVLRKLEIVKPFAGAPPSAPGWLTNAQYTISVSNAVGFECWYPSSNSVYNRPVTIYASDDCNMILTNNVGAPFYTFSALIQPQAAPPLPAGSWPGSPGMGVGTTTKISPHSFRDPLVTNVIVLPDSVLLLQPPRLVNSNLLSGSIPFQTTSNYFTPRFGFNVTNRVRLIMVDSATGRLIDYVQLGGLGGMSGPDTTNDIQNDLITLDSQALSTLPLNNSSPLTFSMWLTNAVNPGAKNFTPLGFYNQVSISQGQYQNIPPSLWNKVLLPGAGASTGAEMNAFGNFFKQNSTLLSMEVPLVAYGKYRANYVWAANDPLVHYMTSDLTSLAKTNDIYYYTAGISPLTNYFGKVDSSHYQPWNINGQFLPNVPGNEIGYKDPLVYSADYWQFPSNKFPNIGWLGRVHRGTPWQTVYLKSFVNTNDWPKWTGDPYTWTTSIPTSDYILMDLFTTSPNDNASKGQLSINQTNSAAWAAVLDGVFVLTNTGGNLTNLVPWPIDPTNHTIVNGVDTNTVHYLVNSINAWRTNFTGGTFTSLGQICSVPQLTIASPFLNTNTTPNYAGALNDAAYERIPQQIMSLLRLGTPRYVIFAYGQSLKPADRSIVQSGKYFGMCTNYQITGEVVTRAVVRFDNFPIPGQPGGTAKPRAVIESFNVLPPE